MAATLREHVMGELSQRPMTVDGLAYELGADYFAVRTCVLRLLNEGLITPAGSFYSETPGRKPTLYDVVRLRKAA